MSSLLFEKSNSTYSFYTLYSGNSENRFIGMEVWLTKNLIAGQVHFASENIHTLPVDICFGLKPHPCENSN